MNGSTMTSSITAAVCTLDRHESLERLLRRLAPQVTRGNHRMLIVDSSHDARESRAMASSMFPPDRLEYLRGNGTGLSAARNLAARWCRTPYIAYIDDDAIPCDDWLESIAALFDECGPSCGVAGGRIEPAWLAPRPRWLPDELLPYLSLLDLGPEQRELGKGEHLYGTNIAYRVNLLNRSGAFRTGLGKTPESPRCNEETDLQRRLTSHGIKAVYSPRIAVKHKIPPDRLTRSWFYRRVFWQAVSDLAAEQGPNDALSSTIDEIEKQDFDPGSMLRRDQRDTVDPRVFLANCGSIYERTLRMLWERGIQSTP